MKTALIYVSITISAIILIYFILYDISDYNYFSYAQRYSSTNILETFENYLKKKKPEEKAIIDYDSLLSELSIIDKMFAENVFSIPPDELGFKGPFYSKEKPGNLIKIESVPLESGEETGIQYLPEHVYRDYIRMMEKMQRDINKKLYVDSGYRSPGRQAYLFFYYLVKSNNFSLNENAKWIAMPGYSEHGHPVNTAIDFVNLEGINGISKDQTAEDFVKLPEYHWLLANAKDFNFYLSYPVGNNLGVSFEPWHWHWEEKQE